MDHVAHATALPLEEAAESLSSLPAEWLAYVAVSGQDAYEVVAGLGAECRSVEYVDAQDGKRRRSWIAEATMLGGVRVIATWTEVIPSQHQQEPGSKGCVRCGSRIEEIEAGISCRSRADRAVQS